MIKYALQYLQSATTILQQYDGSMPLQHFLKSFFSADKKFGSKDRRNISHLCYSYFRLGHAGKHLAVKDRIAIVLFVSKADEWQQLFPADWIEQLNLDTPARLELVKKTFDIHAEDIFPFYQLSAGIMQAEFAWSHIHQPKLFIRIRSGKEAYARKHLMAANIEFEEVSEHAFAFKNNTKVDEVLKINEDYVVQDINSQRVGEFMQLAKRPYYMKVWDCCAASGGKSILAHDVLKDIQLTVTDVRASIINNLKNRLQQAQVKNYTSFVADVANQTALAATLKNEQFDLVICDAPCSGSGTWGRTPEQLYYFNEEKINTYATIQQQVAMNAIGYVKQGGYLLYITCSVFRQENEDVVNNLQQRFNLRLIQMHVLQGYGMQADTMFAALLQTH
jgi:16S rRNA (cytosine967-C5)-methyltransferase